MPKTKISEFSATPANNTDIDSINIAEGCAPSGINDAIRELMAQLKDFQTGAVGDSFNGPIGSTTPAAGTFTSVNATSVTNSGLTSGRVTYAGASGLLVDSANLTFSGTTLTLKNGYYEAYDPVDSTSAGLGMRFYTDGGGTKTENGRLTVAQTATSGSLSSMIFQTNNGTTLAEKVRITGAGSVGIGTSSPTKILHVRGTSPVVIVEPSLGSQDTAINIGRYGLSGTVAPTSTRSYLEFGFEGNDDTYSTAIESRVITSSSRLNSAADLGFFTKVAGGNLRLERMTITSAGDVGIGTTSPFTTAANRGNISLNGTTDAIFAIGTGGTRRGYIYADSAHIEIVADGYMALAANGAERARIDSSGNLLVGTTSTGNAHILQTATSGVYSTQFISSTASSPYGININFSGAAPNGTGNQFLYCNDSSALRMEVRSNGGIANYSANNVNLSDRREKTNFAPATSYLDKICAIPVQTFNYIDQNLEEDAGLTLGVVAQDVQAVAPELVMESNWASKDEEPKMRLSIYQTDLQYALMKCIQEQQAIIESLKARLDAANL